MTAFDKIGPENTPAAAEIAVKRAIELDTDIVAASNQGDTAYALLSEGEKQGFKGNIVIITQVSKAAANGVNVMPPEVKADLKARGVIFVTAGHALSGAERGLSTKYKGIYPVEIIADTLRTISRGTKVCYEVSVMALDADAIPYGKPVVAVGGSGRGADTVCVITPGYSANILDTKVNEIICKPNLYE